MRAAILFFLGLFLGACTTAHPRAQAPSTTFSHVAEAAGLVSKSVALVRHTDGTAQAYCSGVWVSPSVILTANHCVADDELFETVFYVVKEDVDFEPIKSRSAALVARDAEHDLALLRAKSAPSHEVSALSVEALLPGLFVQTMGQPLGFWWSYSSGEIAAVRVTTPATDSPDFLFVQATVPISPGNSGGALFDEYGMIVGICHGSYNRGQHVNFFIHPIYIDALLRANGIAS